MISNQLLADVGKRALEVAEQAREKKKQKKEQKLKKKKEEEEEEEQSSEEEEEVGGRELPSVKSDKTLAGIAAKVKGIDFAQFNDHLMTPCAGSRGRKAEVERVCSFPSNRLASWRSQRGGADCEETSGS